MEILDGRACCGVRGLDTAFQIAPVRPDRFPNVLPIDNFGADSKSGVEPPQAKPWRASGSSRDSAAFGSGLRKSVALAHPSAGPGVDVRGIDHAGVDTFHRVFERHWPVECAGLTALFKSRSSCRTASPNA